MSNILIDFRKTNGKIKPMHAVNNGPVGSKVRATNGTYEYFRAAGIPYARNHDASFASAYGGEYTVDVHRIFRNFDADPTDPANYDFECTDQYVANTFSVGTEVYYRLGSRIEHGKKVGTFPPKDFQKWAVICEHIIRHYNEGWADGFQYGITYWEIWNEPDCRNPDGSNPCWQGTDEEFIVFFRTALKHLKGCFPNLKIGGPAFCSCGDSRTSYMRSLFDALKADNLSLDFFSFHRYTNDPVSFRKYVMKARNMCDEYGFTDAEIHLNEWNYLRGWLGDEFIYTVRSIKGLKGASFSAAVMAVCQDAPLDMLMYYDARPCAFNGLFDTDLSYPLKGYYTFKFFGELYRMGEFVRPEYTEGPIFATAACGNGKAGVMLTNFAEDDASPAVQVTLELLGVEGKTAKLYLLDQAKDATPVDTIQLSEKTILDIPLYSVCFLSIEE